MLLSQNRQDRRLTVAACQLGPIHLADSRESVLKRMYTLLDQAAAKDVKLAVFPELAFTTFFPRYLLEAEELSQFFEEEDPSKGGLEQCSNVKPLLEYAHSLGIDLYVGYAERSVQEDGSHVNYNTCAYYSASTNQIISKYRKVHLPGAKEPYTAPGAVQQLEKRYFRPGDLGFQAFRAPGLVQNAVKRSDDMAKIVDTAGSGDPIMGMLICNDRRWAEAWRVYGMQGVEMVCCGHNTTAFATDAHGKMVHESLEAAEQEALFHHKLSCQANSYMNACFSINVAKTGAEDGNPFIGGTMIVHPNGHIIKEAVTKDDELVTATIDLADCQRGKSKVFAFEKHRRPEHYATIVERAGVIEPPLL